MRRTISRRSNSGEVGARLSRHQERLAMPMRSLLFVPADSERKLARGLESGADALILDLEDSVAAPNRPTARKLAREFLEAHGPERIRRYLRINPLVSGLAL